MHIIPKSTCTLSLFSAQTGALSARLDREDGTFLHLHSMVDPEAEAELFADQVLWGDRIVLAGCGLGYHLGKCIKTIRPDAHLLVIDYYRELTETTGSLLAGLIHNQVTLLSADMPDSELVVKKFIAGGSMVQVLRHPASYRSNEWFYAELLGEVIGQKNKRGIDSLLLMQGGFFAEAEIGRAAMQKEIMCTSFEYKKVDQGIWYENYLQELLQKDPPAAIISVNMLGIDSDGILTTYAGRYGIPIVTWFVDDPRPILLTRKSMVSPFSIACTWERAFTPFLESCGYAKVQYLPLAGDPSVKRNTGNAGSPVKVGFVGSSMGEHFLADIAGKFLWKESYRDIASKIAPEILGGAFERLDSIICDALPGNLLPDEHTQTWLRSYCLHYASMLKRKLCVTALQPEGIELFGDPDGWKNLLGNKVITHRDIDYQHEVSGIYQRTAININCTSCQMPTAVNQRVFDIPLCGGFMLTDNQLDLGELFTANEVAVYHSEKELLDTTRYYLNHPDERDKISKAAQQHIVQEHTYRHRLEKLLSLI